MGVRMRKSEHRVIGIDPLCDSVSWETWSEKWGSWDSWFQPKLQTPSVAGTPQRHSRLRELLFMPLAMINKPSREDRRWFSMPKANH